MATVTEQNIQLWGKTLNDGSQPLVERYHALRNLKHIENDMSIDLISQCFKSKSDLLKHDLAYTLGQMGNENAIKILNDILDNENEAPIVRHEAGEALAAIGHLCSLCILRKHSKSNNKELAETCYIGYKRIEWFQHNKSDVQMNNFKSIDPAPEYDIDEKSVDKLSLILLNTKEDIFEKYRALFTLRYIANSGGENGNKALISISKALKCPSSALFRYQVAFVLGQLAKLESIHVLHEALANLSDLGMVRHESAEALGAIGNDQCKEILHQFLNDKEQVVKETCVVCLDVNEYNSSEHF